MTTVLPQFPSSRALVSDPSGNPIGSQTTAQEVAYLSGVTNPIQPQLTQALQQTVTYFNVSAGTVTLQPNSYYFADSSAGTVVVLLPLSGTAGGYMATVKKTDASGNNIVLRCAGTNTLDGSQNYAFSVQYMSVQVACNSLNWYIL